MHDRLLSKHRYQRLAWYIQRGTFQNEAIVIAICWKMVIFSAIPKISIEASPNILHTTQNHSHRRSCFLTRNRLVGTHLGSCAVDQTSTPLPPLGRQLFLQRGGNLAVVPFETDVFL